MNALQPVRWLLRPLRDGLGRLVHPLNRRRARRTLRGVGSPGVVVFVCLGNICRSPFAAARFRQLAEKRGSGPVEARSVGFIGPGRPCPPEAQAASLELGVDVSRHRSRTVRAGDLEEADLIVVMAPFQRTRLKRELGVPAIPVILLGDLDPERAPRRAIPDPWGKPPEAFRETFERIDRCLGELAATMASDRVRDGVTTRAARP